MRNKFLIIGMCLSCSSYLWGGNLGSYNITPTPTPEPLPPKARQTPAKVVDTNDNEEIREVEVRSTDESAQDPGETSANSNDASSSKPEVRESAVVAGPEPEVPAEDRSRGPAERRGEGSEAEAPAERNEQSERESQAPAAEVEPVQESDQNPQAEPVQESDLSAQMPAPRTATSRSEQPVAIMNARSSARGSRPARSQESSEAALAPAAGSAAWINGSDYRERNQRTASAVDGEVGNVSSSPVIISVNFGGSGNASSVQGKPGQSSKYTAQSDGGDSDFLASNPRKAKKKRGRSRRRSQSQPQFSE